MSKYTLVILFLVSLFTRLLVVYTIPEIRVSSDSQEYLELADSLSNEFRFYRDNKPETYRTPGYPFFLSSIVIITGNLNLYMVSVLQSIMFSIEIVLVFVITLRLFNIYSAYIAIFILITNPGNLLRVTSILTESLFVFVLVLLIWIFISRYKINNELHNVYIGVGIGLLSLTRPIASWLFIPIMLVFLYSSSKRQFFRCMVFFLIGIVLTQGLWMVRNYYYYGSLYFSEISAASLYVYWAQSVKSIEEGEPTSKHYKEAWKDWNESRSYMTPPEMKEVFTNKALKQIITYPDTVIYVWINGIKRLLVDSGFTKLLKRYQMDIPLTASSIKKAIYQFEKPYIVIMALLILIGRILEIAFICVIHFGVIYTLCKPSFIYKNMIEQRRAVLFISILVIYLFILSSNPSANVRFREQYLSSAIILASPAILEFYHIIKNRWKKRSLAIG